MIEIAFERQGVKRNSLHVVMELDSTEAIKSAVEAGLGVGFVSRWAIAKDMRLDNSFKIVNVEGLLIKRKFLIAYASGPEPWDLPRNSAGFSSAAPVRKELGQDQAALAIRPHKKRKWGHEDFCLDAVPFFGNT